MALGDLGQNSRKRGLEGEIIASRKDTQLVLEKITHSLDERVNRLALICEAMWQLIKEQTELNEDDLKKRITKIELQEGRLEGKINRTVSRELPQICPECGARLSRKYNHCQFCGYKSQKKLSPFQSLK